MKRGVRFILIGLCALFSLSAFSANFPTSCGGVTGSIVAGKYIVVNCSHNVIGSTGIATADQCFVQVCAAPNSHKVHYNASWAANAGSVCPTNSTKISGECVPNSGYSAVYNSETLQWSVVPTGSECSGGQTYNSTTGDCEGAPLCGDIANPSTNPACTCEAGFYKYVTDFDKYRCSAGSSNETAVIGVLAASLGLAVATATGLFTSFAACIASVVCAGAMALAGLGTLVAGIGFATDDDPSSGINPAATLQVKLAPANSPTPSPQNNAIRVGSQGEIVPPLNATQDPSNLGRYTWTSGSQTAMVDTNNNTVSINDTATPDTSYTISTSGTQSAQVSKVQLQPFGTSSSGGTVRKTTTTKATYSQSGASQGQSQTQYEENGNVTENPPVMGVCVAPGCIVGGNGSGNGEGEGSNGNGDCAEYGCAKEVTQLRVLSSLIETPPNNIEQLAQSKADSLYNSLLASQTELTDNMGASINNFLSNSGLDSMFEGWGAFNPFANIDNSTCSIQSQWFGNRVLSYCDEQPVIHILMQFMFSLFFALRIFSLVTNENGYDRAMF